MNQNAFMLAIAGGALVWWLWTQQRTGRAAFVEPRRTAAGTWQYPAGSLPGPTEVTYRDPSGAVLFRPDAPDPMASPF